MRYKVVPFRANISTSGGAADVANQLASLISSEATGGWEYVRLETVETTVAGDAGWLAIQMHDVERIRQRFDSLPQKRNAADPLKIPTRCRRAGRTGRCRSVASAVEVTHHAEGRFGSNLV